MHDRQVSKLMNLQCVATIKATALFFPPQLHLACSAGFKHYLAADVLSNAMHETH